MRKKDLLTLPLPLIALILECMPDGVVLFFGNPDGEPFRHSYSYFSLTPFGYANFAPLLTGIATVLAVVLLLVFCLTGRETLARIARTVTAVGTVLSVGPLLLGRNYYTPMGIFVTLSLLAGTVVTALLIQKRHA